MEIRAHLYPEDTGWQISKLQYQLRVDFYRYAGITVLESIMLSILLVELSRIIFPGTLSWSNGKHTAVVILTSFAISAVRVAALNSISGHGII